jgi:heparan-alpha-glucosaminide N-acetyltransferase
VLQAGRIIVHHKQNPWGMVKRWVCWGVALCGIATALCGASKNDGVMPINKNLWSPSFIFVMAGTGMSVRFSIKTA